jgi:murein DD-endopeptidase MepM/ murein hydrolase activator NlpD
VRRWRTSAKFVCGTLLLLLTLLVARTRHERLSETRAKLRATRARIASLRRTDTQLLAVIGAIGGQLRATQAQLASAKARFNLVQFRINSTERKIARLDAARRARAQQISRRARQLYILGPGARFEAVMNADDLGDLIDRTSSIDFVIRFDRVVIQDIARITHVQQVARRQLEREKEEARVARRQVYARAEVVYEALSTRRVAERALKDRIAAFQQEARALEAEQARILTLIRSRASSVIGPVSHRGFQWPIRGAITSPYGPRWGGFHTGIDIDCETGDPIHAAKSGRVIASEWGGGYGNMIIIDHGNGVTTLYGHQSRLIAHDGQSVPRGQTIGRCGSTGHSTGSHLHFEVRINGHHTNPRPFLP